MTKVYACWFEGGLLHSVWQDEEGARDCARRYGHDGVGGLAVAPLRVRNYSRLAGDPVEARYIEEEQEDDEV